MMRAVISTVYVIILRYVASLEFKIVIRTSYILDELTLYLSD